MENIVLVTGGAGFIGSHAIVSLVKAGYTPIILDNLSNSFRSVIDRLNTITGTQLNFIKGDILDAPLIKQIFNQHPVKAVLHFAGLKSVDESLAQPLKYYENNVKGTLNLLNAMTEAQVKTFIFSSSATVYGDLEQIPYIEHYDRIPVHPYGRCKMQVEDILDDLYQSDRTWRIACLRYFNPIGAHESGLIGENPQGKPNNLMPHLTQVVTGKKPCLPVFGSDYSTPDGTCIRDYIHVMDLAEGHIAALNYLLTKPDLLHLNLGTGQGNSVLEVIRTFELANQCKVPYALVDRRPGDLPAYYADVKKAYEMIGWKAKRTLHQMCVDSWSWVKNHVDEDLLKNRVVKESVYE